MTGNDKSLGNPGVVPLRTILTNFLNLVENTEASGIDGYDTYDQEFQELKQFSENLKSDSSYLCKEGEKSANRKKNRYKDILPFDYTRVILGDYGDVPGSDYINANFIKGASGSSAYIACQGPLPHTVNDFWRMVVECEVQVIVMACNEQESGKHKCENYWVEEEEGERQFGQVTIWLKKCRNVCPDFLVRTMRIRYKTSSGDIEERNVCQFHYSAWPDHGVPTKVRPLLDMVRLIRDCQTSETLPVLVHCSAGCGRTGTICAIDYVWGLLRLGKLSSDFSLFHLVREMRRQRIAMVQTKDQYVLVHKAVKELFEEQLKIIDSHPYANVNEYGLPLDIKSDLEEPTYEMVEYSRTLNVKPLQIPSKPILNPPLLPLPNGEVAVNNSKVEKQLDNHCLPEDGGHNSNSNSKNGNNYIPPGATSQAYQKLDDITVLSSDGEEKVEREKESTTKGTRSNAIRNALLRKPSIVKLKAFFEKSKDGKKSTSGGLSRAKSDVSSRFYTFNNITSPFSSKQSGSKSPDAKVPTDEKESFNFSKEIANGKPPLLAKPTLPIKRSKSLKLGKEDPPPNSFEPSSHNSKEVQYHKDNGLEPSVTIRIKSPPVPGSSSFIGVNNVTNNPIRVSIKQVDIPELQLPVSKSIKPEIQTAVTQELNKIQVNQRNVMDTSSSVQRDRNYTNDTKPTLIKNKPTVPPKIHILNGNSSQTNHYGSPTKIKMGVAKEMEDVDLGQKKYSGSNNVRKYDTVTSNILQSGNKRTSLTRSQSHVWQPTKIQIPARIFSDENIHQTSGDLLDYEMINSSSRMASQTQSNGNIYHPRENSSASECRSNPDNLESTYGERMMSIKQEDHVDGHYQQPKISIEKPTVRRRVPKTNPYANYVPSSILNSQKSANSITSQTITTVNSQSRSQTPSEVIKINTSPTSTNNFYGESRDLPLLKSGNGRSRENSSESSSNTATPRSSLPSTPTQTIDTTYKQLMGSNLQSFSNNSNKSSNKLLGNPPPKSILKGSLSSTPSESDERLDIPRQIPSPMKPNVITAPQKINTVRIAVGVRERRNSFRQAVWKEDQSCINADVQDSPSNPFLFSNGVTPTLQIPTTETTTVVNSTPSTGYVNRSHKDYEPIWLDSLAQGGPKNRHQIRPDNLYRSSDDYIIQSPPKLNESDKISIEYPNPTENVLVNGFSIKQNYSRNQVGIPQGQRRDIPNVGNSNLNPPAFQNRMDEIKVLLEELKAPTPTPVRKLSSDKDSSVPSEVRNRSGSTTSVNLKHQRSLRTPTRPYHPGLSCFTFKKPTSLESITDPSHYDIKKSVNGESSTNSKPNGFYSPEKKNSEFFTDHNGKGRNSNDYVSVSLKPTYKNYEVIHGLPQYDERVNFSTLHDNQNDAFIPIAPPRAKRSQNFKKNPPSENLNASASVTASSNVKVYDSLGSENMMSSGWNSNSNSTGQNRQSRNQNLPEVVRCTSTPGTDYSDQQTRNENYQQGITSKSSPDFVVKTLGLFQSKTVNMRSMLGLGGSKEKTGSDRNSGAPLISKDDCSEGGFIASNSSVPNFQQHRPVRSKSKHQYL